MNGYPWIDEDFYDSPRTDPADRWVPPEEIKHTIEFVSNLHPKTRETIEVAGGSGFRYVDREISPLRTAQPGGARPKRRPLDLLLVSDDGPPIAGELKIRNDRLPYFALVQAMMYGGELVSENQRQRLAKYRPDAGFIWPDRGPYIELWIVSFEFDPENAPTYRAGSLEATKAISEKLMDDSRFSSVVRRIAYIEVSGKSGALEFKELFGFGPQASR